MQLLRSLRDVRRQMRGELPRDDEPRYAAYTAERLSERPFINVGAGKFKHPFWTNVDYSSEWYGKHQPAAFVHYDLTQKRPLPFADASVELMYTSHTIEHVADDMVDNLLREAHRVLVPGGGVRITCPDASLLVRSARLNKLDYWRWRRPWFQQTLSSAPSLAEVTIEDFLVREIATPRCRFYVNKVETLQPECVRERLNTLDEAELLHWLVKDLEFRPQFPGDHINWWTEGKVVAALQRAGFEHVYRSRRSQSLFAPMTHPKLFDSTQPYNSLFVEAIR